ncbi:MAG: 23S rRNA (pseudouridine(1915)-N(3))-methyltransferase RlmH [Burkholderiales bacterium]|jgi:23S rRNA (pseudouridine1915-N3)-methyltransferase|nr:23S rRNA (pseudouridine(1915)-N(3))-methyltransferase RlmH [Burkholderiales bacterium]
MRLHIVASAHKLPDWVTEGVADYARRFPRDWSLTVLELKAEPRDRGKTVAQILAAEALRIESGIATASKNARRVVLDERGTSWSTKTLAEKLSGWRDEARDVVFVVGSADGLDPALKTRADDLWSLSAATLPHGLARLILVEQLYRAISIINHHPYHRE